MPTFAVYLSDGTVLGAADAKDAGKAAEAVVNGVEWPDDTAMVEVNVAKITSADYTLPDEMDVTHSAIKPTESNLTVTIHD